MTSTGDRVGRGGDELLILGQDSFIAEVRVVVTNGMDARVEAVSATSSGTLDRVL